MTTCDEKLDQLMLNLSMLEKLRPFLDIKNGDVFKEVWDVLIKDTKEQAAAYVELRMELDE